MQRDEVVTLVDRAGLDGLAYLALVVMLNGTSIGELCLIVRRERHAVSDVLRELELRHFVVRVQVGRGFEWFPSEEAVSFMRSNDGRKTYHLPPTTTTTLLNPSPESKEAVEAGNDGRKIYHHSLDPGQGIDDELLLAFRSAGIGSNAWQMLAEKEWIDADYVRAHDEYRRGRGETVGLMITRMRCGDLPPELPDKEVDVAKDWKRLLQSRRDG